MVTRILRSKYDLDTVKSIPLERISFSKAADRDRRNLGYTVEDVKNCVESLQESNFTGQVSFPYGVGDAYLYCNELEPIDDWSDATYDELYLKFILQEETEIYFWSFHQQDR